MSRFTSSRQRTNWLEFTLWLLTFLLVYLLPPATGEVSEGAGVLAPLLPVATAWTYRLAGLLVLAGFSAFAIYIGEYFLLIERVERPLLVLFMLAIFTTTPSIGILSAGALIFQLLILLLSFGTYQDTHQPRVSLFIGLLVGVLSLVSPVYLLLVPVIIWGQYHLRSIAWRPIIALLLMGNGALQAYGAFALRAFPLPMPQELKSFQAVPLASYAVVLVTFFVGYLLYRRRYYRESVRHRDLFSAMQLYPLVLLLAVPFVAGESAALLQLTLLPIAFLIARGMGMLPQRMALVLRSILLVLLLSQYLYALGVFELFRRVG